MKMVYDVCRMISFQSETERSPSSHSQHPKDNFIQKGDRHDARQYYAECATNEIVAERNVGQRERLSRGD